MNLKPKKTIPPLSARPKRTPKRFAGAPLLPSDPTARQQALADVNQQVKRLLARKRQLSHAVALDVLQAGYFEPEPVAPTGNTDLAIVQAVLAQFEALHLRLYQASLSSVHSLYAVIDLGEQYITELNRLIKQNDQNQANDRG